MKKLTKAELARLAAAAALGAALTGGLLNLPEEKVIPSPSDQPVGWQEMYDALQK